MKRISISFFLLLLMVVFAKPTFANLYLTGPLTKQTVTENDPLKIYLEYSYEKYNLQQGSGYSGGILYHLTQQIGIAGSITYSQEVPKEYCDKLSNDLDKISNYPLNYTNFSLFLGNLNQLLLFIPHTHETRTNKYGLAHSFQLSNTNKVLFGGGSLMIKNTNSAFEESPFMIIEFQNEQTYCRLQYVSGLTTEFTDSGSYWKGPKEISWILTFGYTF